MASLTQRKALVAHNSTACLICCPNSPAIHCTRQSASTSVTILRAPSAMPNPQNSHSRPQTTPSSLTTWLIFVVIFAAVQFASLFNPPLMDDVDASHAQTAQHIIDSGNWITTQTNGIRYIEKPPLPFWLVTIAYKVAGENAFGWLGFGHDGPGGRGQVFTPDWVYSPRSVPFCLLGSSFPKQFSACYFWELFTAF
jgi:hypothetical protein